jgi:aminoglycoside 3-N-acetyltransferase
MTLDSGEVPITQDDLIHDLRGNLGIGDGDIIAVHSSMKSMGRVVGGPEAFIGALIQAVGGTDVGTVLMPCFNGPLDVVDLRSTPCRLGLVPETFRNYPGVIRSVNHTHSVAIIGKDAAGIAATHRGREPLGVDSPFHELAKRGGHVVHVGCSMNSSSIIHIAESMVKAPYLDIAYPQYNKNIELVVSDAERFICRPGENPGCSRNFMVVQEELDRLGLLVKGKVGQADSFKVTGTAVIDAAVRILRERGMGALLCDSPACGVCMAKKERLASLGM